MTVTAQIRIPPDTPQKEAAANRRRVILVLRIPDVGVAQSVADGLWRGALAKPESSLVEPESDLAEPRDRRPGVRLLS
jgi:hypothetical protein